MWVYLVFSRKELIKVDFKSKPCFSQQVKFKHQPQPLSLYLRAKKSDHLLFSPLVLQPPLEIRWGRNFSNSWSWGFGLMRPYENLFVGPFPFCLKPPFCVKLHHQSRLSYLNKHFPRGCAFCLIIKLFCQTFYFFMNFEYFFSFCMFPTCTYSFWEILWFVLKNLSWPLNMLLL